MIWKIASSVNITAFIGNLIYASNFAGTFEAEVLHMLWSIIFLGSAVFIQTILEDG